MKTTIDIPDELLREAIAFSGCRTKKDVVVSALTEFNRHQRMMRLVKSFGTCDRMMTAKDLEQSRSEG